MALPQEETADESFDFGDCVDLSIFEQILDMDAEDDREFSQSIVFDFFSQAHQTFEQMDESLEAKDLKTLSDKGHFLKGSSATLGFTRIKDECEKIQNYGKGKNETGTADEPDEEKLLQLTTDAIKVAKYECKEVEVLMKKYYEG